MDGGAREKQETWRHNIRGYREGWGTFLEKNRFLVITQGPSVFPGVNFGKYVFSFLFHTLSAEVGKPKASYSEEDRPQFAIVLKVSPGVIVSK